MKTKNDRRIYANIKNIELQFQTDPILFSPRTIDKGTLAMLSVVEFQQSDKVLDLGCGYGVVGILAAKLIGQNNVTMCDISPIAVECARENTLRNQVSQVTVLESNGFEKICDNDFTLILSNPPYHADFSVPKRFIEEGYRYLVTGGKFVMVTKRQKWYKQKFISVFGGVKIHKIGDYFVFISEKRNFSPERREKNRSKLSKKLTRKYHVK